MCCTFNTSFSSVQFLIFKVHASVSGRVDHGSVCCRDYARTETSLACIYFRGPPSRRGATELIIKPFPLATQLCCTFRPTSFSFFGYSSPTLCTDFLFNNRQSKKKLGHWPGCSKPRLSCAEARLGQFWERSP